MRRRRWRRRASGELKDVLNFSNWELYIDTPDSRKAAGMTGPTTLEQFTEKTGIKVNYYEDINDNPEYFAKVQGRLRQGQGIDRDIFVVDRQRPLLGEYIENGWVQKLDKSLIPNISNLIDAQATPPFDPNREYSLPWFSGMDGIAWNEDITGPVTSVTQLLEDPKLKGKVGVWSQMGDTLGLVMLENGDDPAKVTDESFDRAIIQDREGRRLRPDPPVLRQRLRAAAREGRSRGEHRVVGRHLPAREPEAQVGDPGDGRDHLDGQHVHPARRQRADGVDVHELRLRPEDRGADRPRRELHLVGQGRQGRGGEARSEGGREHAHLPDDEMLSQLHQNDPAMFTNPDYTTRWLAVQGK